VFVLAGTLASLVHATAFAQDEKPKPPPLTAGWRDGFVIQSEQGDFRLQIGALIHADGRFAAGDDSEAVNDTFLIRRARPYLRARVGKYFEFYLNPDFGGGSLVLQDAYLDTMFSPAFRLRIGKGKSPFGLERLQSSSNMLFYERALPTALVPNRDVGVQVLGDVAGGRISYAAAVTNGVADGGSADVDTGDSKDVVGRVLVRPFTRNTDSALRALGLGLSGSVGRQTGSAALPTFRTSSLQQTFFSYAGATGDGVRTRYSPQGFYYYKSFNALAEYVHSEMPARRNGYAADARHDAWQVAAAYVLTGEAATESSAGLRPRANFDVGARHFGAFQLAARYHVLKIGEDALPLSAAGTVASRKAEAWTVGLNWYLTPHFKYVFNFERTVFDDAGEGARPPENAYVFRTQVSF
jgi:phosphate-selective porin OprO/OprP